MFTGIIEEIGTMRSISRQGQAMILGVQAKLILTDIHLGDSISVNGVCLTVIAFDTTSFTVDVMPETFRHTNLRKLQHGDRVNLERAMSAQGRFGGHIVQGHVDAPGRIVSRTVEENAVAFTIEPEDSAILKYIIPRGSITLDGISLTVVRVVEGTFTVSIIPHTLAQTILIDKHAGASINIECDLLGKYVERLLQFQGSTEGTASKKTGLTHAYLVENGFN
ncbi:riboflavin synthase [Paenibacillus psychroresistens]|uniref:Riboflavin synthase n=1 Tax=Paenibacillus psychroresistens TaxID=1778678 RepID=A0A6B8RI52_9BACL|nr:riboflavin synthase [Paenibacillus psychroresistens]QGQ96131.1 riboflavin synthase [Paenibacillus psychroresistens]